MLSPSTVALMIGKARSASAAANVKNGRKVSFTPVLARKSAFTWSRYAATRVTSTSTTVVSWAMVCIETTARSATTLRSRDIGTVVPRSGEVSSGVAAGAAAGAAAGDGAGVLAASRTSCLRIRPPTPVPVREPRSMPLSCASLRTIGVTYPACEVDVATAGAAGAATAAGAGAAAAAGAGAAGSGAAGAAAAGAGAAGATG